MKNADCYDSDSQNQIKSLSQKCENLEKAMFKLQYENIRLRNLIISQEQNISNLQNTIISLQNMQNNQNTLNIKESKNLSKIWDEIISECILDTFSKYFDNPEIISNFINSINLATFHILKEQKTQIIETISKMIKTELSETENLVMPIMLKNKEKIFTFNEEILADIKLSAIKILETNHKPFGKFGEIFNKNTNGHEFIQKIHNLNTQIVLENKENNKKIELNFKIVQFDKNIHYCIDGFIKEKSQCIILFESLLPNILKSAIIPYTKLPAEIIRPSKTFSEEIKNHNSLENMPEKPYQTIQIETQESGTRRGSLHVKRSSFGGFNSSMKKPAKSRKLSQKQSDILGKYNGVYGISNYYT